MSYIGAIQKTTKEFKKWVNYTEKNSMNDLKGKNIDNPGEYNEKAGDKNFTVFADYYKQKTGIDVQGMAWCFTGATLVLTDVGYKHISDLKAGDKVLSGYGTGFNTVLSNSSHKATVSEFRTYANMCNWVTKDHPILSSRRKRNVDKSKEFDDKDFNTLESLRKYDRCYIPRRNSSEDIGLTDDELWLLGYYISDGCVDGETFKVCANDKKLEILRSKNLPLTYLSDGTNHEAFISTDNNTLIELLKDCGDNLNKRIPTKILYGSIHDKSEFIKGYIDADEYDNNTFTTSSVELALALSKLVFDIGKRCSMKIYNRKDNVKVFNHIDVVYKYIDQEPIIYVCNLDDKYNNDEDLAPVPIKYIGLDVFEDDVYTLDVDGDNTYTANNLAVHNCDTFVDTMFIHLYGVDTARKMLGGFDAYTPGSAQKFKDMGRWFKSEPQEGDVIFFKNSERICHTGYVYKVDRDNVYTVEGNTSRVNNIVVPNGGCVAMKYYSKSNPRIAGYGRPKYEVVPDDEDTTSKKKANITYEEGWMRAADGKRWWYQFSDGSYAKNNGTNNGWYNINDRWYLFDTNGYMLTGHQVIGGNEYYLCDDPNKVEGALMIADASGALQVWEDKQSS